MNTDASFLHKIGYNLQRITILIQFPFLIPQVENVRMIDRYNSKNSIVGTLYLTTTHLIFVDPEANKETWVSVPSNQFQYFNPFKATTDVAQDWISEIHFSFVQVHVT